jgi:23S rRNA pseudouridine2605 synthase
MKLNVFIAKSGHCSRRNAGIHIRDGRVKVNNEVVCKPWREVKPDDIVLLDGKSLFTDDKKVYLLVNKPKGVTVTLADRFARRKITDLVPKKCNGIYPVGRLDKDSRDLVILTNDGQLCYQLTHPKFGIEKEYIVWVKGKLGDLEIERLKKGIKDAEDLLKIKSCARLALKDGNNKLKIVVCEGKKRHIRRLLEKAGFPVIDLKRVRIGTLQLGDLKEGEFREADKSMIYSLAFKNSKQKGVD